MSSKLVNINPTQKFNIEGLQSPPLNIIDLHTFINRCDSIKDALPSKSRINNHNAGSLFSNASIQLFPIANVPSNLFNGENYKKFLTNIKKSVFDSNGLGGNLGLGLDPESIVSLKINKALKDRLKRDLKAGDTEAGNLVEKLLPETYQYAFHDSGDPPFTIQGGITQILTPGSYIDPFKRLKQGIRLPINGTTDLTQYGFPGLKFNWEWNKPNSDDCTIRLQMNDIDITETRDSTHEHVGKTIDYFAGNPIKNKWFNDHENDRTSPILDAKKYILCKELGDTTQATFARYLFETQPTKYTTTNSCLFTLDDVLSLRCRLLGVPCCAKDHGKTATLAEDDQAGEPDPNEKHFRLLFYTPMEDIEEIKRTRNTIQIRECIKHNESMKTAINRILIEGFYKNTDFFDTNFINANPYLRSYFLAISGTIDKVRSVLESMLQNANEINRPEEDIRRIVAYLRINEFIKVNSKDKFKTYKLIHTVRNLFQYDTSDFYQREIAPKISPSNDELFEDFLQSPTIDVVANFRLKISNQRKQIHEQINFLRDNKKDIDAIMNEWRTSMATTPELVEGGGIYARSRRLQSSANKKTDRAKFTIKLRRSALRNKSSKPSMTYKRFCEKYDFDINNPESGIYDKDTIDLFWILYKNLKINTYFYNELYGGDSRFDYIEDFAFFLYPFFRYLGEATFNIVQLQRMHDMFYVPNEITIGQRTIYNNEFQYVISDYVHNLITSRGHELPSNQNIFLREFMTRPVPLPFSIKSQPRRLSLSITRSINKTKKKRSAIKPGSVIATKRPRSSLLSSAMLS